MKNHEPYLAEAIALSRSAMEKGDEPFVSGVVERGGVKLTLIDVEVTGRLIVMGDPEIGLGDGRIEWVDGGLVRDRAAIEAAIDERIAAYLAARNHEHNEENA